MIRFTLSKALICLVSIFSIVQGAPAPDYNDNFITVTPEAIISRSGSVVGNVGQDIFIASDGSTFVLDWGKEIHGLLTLSYILDPQSQASDASLSLSYSATLPVLPSSLLIPFNTLSDSSTGGNYTASVRSLRQPFRYIRVGLVDPNDANTQGIEFTNITARVFQGA